MKRRCTLLKCPEGLTWKSSDHQITAALLPRHLPKIFDFVNWKPFSNTHILISYVQKSLEVYIFIRAELLNGRRRDMQEMHVSPVDFYILSIPST